MVAVVGGVYRTSVRDIQKVLKIALKNLVSEKILRLVKE